MGKRKRGLRRKRSKLQKKKSNLWHKYHSWGKVKCPALKNQYVYFTRLGWNHLVERKKRSKVEYLKRLQILPLARKVIEKSTTFQSQNRFKGIEYTNFVSYEAGITVKVTITRTSGRYTFFSVRRLV